MLLKKSMFVYIKTLQAEGLGVFQKKLRSCSCETSKKLTTDISEGSTRAFRKEGQLGGAAVLKNPKVALSTIPDFKKLYHISIGLYLGIFV